MENFPISKHDRFPKLEGNQRKIQTSWMAVKNPPSPLFPQAFSHSCYTVSTGNKQKKKTDQNGH